MAKEYALGKARAVIDNAEGQQLGVRAQGLAPAFAFR
jgi:hypothetical protein